MRRWDRLLDEYLEECGTRGLSSITIYGRRLELEKTGCWLKRLRPRRNLEEISSDDLIRYIRSRMTCHSKATVIGVVSILRGMWEFLVRREVWSENPLRWMRGPKLDDRHRLPRRISQSHLRAIWKAAEGLRSKFNRHRDLCVLSLLYGTGLRRGELERLNVDDWDRESATLKVDGRKTGQERVAVMGQGIWRCVEAYLPIRQSFLERTGHQEEPALFVNRRSERLSGQALSRMVQGLARSADVPFVTLHQFRHSCASDLLENGVPLPDVQRVLGHSCIASTMRYTHIADPQRTEAVTHHPINGMLSAVI